MKKITVFRLAVLLSLFIGGMTLFAAEDATTVEKNKKRDELNKQIAEVDKSMIATRAKLIKSDEQLLDLHKQILALQRELMLKIDSKKEMQEHLRKKRQLQSQLKELDEKKQ